MLTAASCARTDVYVTQNHRRASDLRLGLVNPKLIEAHGGAPAHSIAAGDGACGLLACAPAVRTGGSHRSKCTSTFGRTDSGLAQSFHFLARVLPPTIALPSAEQFPSARRTGAGLFSRFGAASTATSGRARA